MSTRYDGPGWVECPSCRSVVPASSAFCPECGNRIEGHPAVDPRAGAHRGRHAPEPEAGTPPWLPIVLGFGGAAILGIAVLLFLLLTRDDAPPVAGASASPTAAATESVVASADASASAEPSEEATPSPSPSPTPRPALANRSIAEVGGDGAELRTQPGGDVIGSLGAGSRLFVIGTPQDASERWYRVAVVAGPYSECIDGFCPNDIGYVSDGETEADAVLAAVSLDCPSSPMTSDELAALLPLERLACYGGSSIVVSGTVNNCYCDGPIGTSFSPAWLAAPVSEFVFDGTSGMWLRFEEPPEDLEPGDVVEARVAMEHEAAPECRASGSNPDDVPSRAEIVLICRVQLVVEDLEVTGFDPSVLP